MSWVERPFVLSSAASEARLELAPTSHEEIAQPTVAWRRDELDASRTAEPRLAAARGAHPRGVPVHFS